MWHGSRYCDLYPAFYFENGCSMHKTSKTAEVLHDLEKYQQDILGISEFRRTGAGKQSTSGGSVIWYSGHSECHERGVAIISSKAKAKTLLEPISPLVKDWSEPTSMPRTLNLASFSVTHQLTKRRMKTKTAGMKSYGLNLQSSTTWRTSDHWGHKRRIEVGSDDTNFKRAIGSDEW